MHCCRLFRCISFVMALTLGSVAGVSVWAGAGVGVGVGAVQGADPALLGDWRFDEGESDIAGDSSGQGHDGEILGATWVKGKFGTALHFAGRDAYVTIPAVAGLDGSAALTIKAWVYWEQGGKYPNIVTGGTWCPGGFLLFVAEDACSFRLGKPGPRQGTANSDWTETSASLVQFTPGRWYHVVATLERPQVQTYVDGKLVATGSWDYPIGYSGDLQIGTWGNPQVCHHGLIDEVQLYNRADRRRSPRGLPTHCGSARASQWQCAGLRAHRGAGRRNRR